MKIKLIHFNFLSENSDTAYFNFSNFKEKIHLWSSVLTESLFNLLTLISINTKNSLQKLNYKVLDISTDIPVKGKLFQRREISKAHYPLSFITAFWIMVSSFFLHIKEKIAFSYKKLFFFRKTYLEFTFFCRNTEVEGFILFLQNFGVFNPYLLYRKI
jgi:hypothetical protein